MSVVTTRVNKNAYIQGDLDWLCGVYSLINAARYIGGLSDDDCHDEFLSTLQYLDSEQILLSTLTKGMRPKILTSILDNVFKQHLPQYHKPFWGRRKKTLSLQIIWQEIAEFISNHPKNCVLISLEGKVSHWTVVTSATQNQFTLLDSIAPPDQMLLLNQVRCTLAQDSNDKKYQLIPKDTIFFTAI